ncbi:MAG: uroporphyrinogen-III C-methyltransferase [Azoarcus sp.]|nr:uroporphyrinogen-III C-methyltransferase [Azoarcus sp.]
MPTDSMPIDPAHAGSARTASSQADPRQTDTVQGESAPVADGPSANASPESAPETGIEPAAPASTAETPAGVGPTPAASPPRAAPPPPPSYRQSAPGDSPCGARANWALLLALAALGFSGYALWQAGEWRARATDLRVEIAERLNDSDILATEARTLARQGQENATALRGRLDEIEDRIEKTEGRSAALNELYQEFSRSREDRALAEAEQAMTIAAQQLQLTGNIEMALIALKSAQARLEQADHGQFAVLRRALAADIDKLSRQDVLDIPATAARFGQLLARVDKMPLAFAGEVPPAHGAPAETPAEENSVSGFLWSLARELWRDIRSLVRIERLDADAEPVLLAPEQSAFLRENLKTRLLTARLALLARDKQTYAADLAQARGWIERFFDARDEEVKAAVSDLHALEAVQVGIERYELIDSIAALRHLQAQARNGGANGVLLPPRYEKRRDGGGGDDSNGTVVQQPGNGAAQP